MLVVAFSIPVVSLMGWEKRGNTKIKLEDTWWSKQLGLSRYFLFCCLAVTGKDVG